MMNSFFDDAVRIKIISKIEDYIGSIMNSGDWVLSHDLTNKEVQTIIDDTFKYFNDFLYSELREPALKKSSSNYNDYVFVVKHTVYWTLTTLQGTVNDSSDTIMMNMCIRYVASNMNYNAERYLDFIKEGKHDITIRATIMSILQHIKVDQPE